MKVAIWYTGHEISRAVCQRLEATFDTASLLHVDTLTAQRLEEHDIHIAYGILRGTAQVFERVQHWFEVDRGFFAPGHYHGFYRMSYRSTQPIYSPYNLTTSSYDGAMREWRDAPGYTLICPPTDAVCQFFGIDGQQWCMNAIRDADSETRIRGKGSIDPIDWPRINRVITFNSSVGFEALERGIEVISDPDHSTIGSYTKAIGKTRGYDRLALFEYANEHQFRLNDGEKIWGIIKRYACSLAGIAVKQSPAMCVATASGGALPIRWTSHS